MLPFSPETLCSHCKAELAFTLLWTSLFKLASTLLADNLYSNGMLILMKSMYITRTLRSPPLKECITGTTLWTTCVDGWKVEWVHDCNCLDVWNIWGDLWCISFLCMDVSRGEEVGPQNRNVFFEAWRGCPLFVSMNSGKLVDDWDIFNNFCLPAELSFDVWLVFTVSLPIFQTLPNLYDMSWTILFFLAYASMLTFCSHSDSNLFLASRVVSQFLRIALTVAGSKTLEDISVFSVFVEVGREKNSIRFKQCTPYWTFEK